MTFKNKSLEILSSSEMINLAEFIVKENFKHHTKGSLPSNYYSSIQSIYKEELGFSKTSKVFVSKNDKGEIQGAIRVLRWDYSRKLPIQKIFGINPIEIAGMSPLKTIWHIGRFAIKKEVSDINLFKKLMICAISPICEKENSVAFAECDSKLLRVLRILGIEATVVGEAVNYLGSETIPVCMTYSGLIGFYRKNKHLIFKSIDDSSVKKSKLPKSVVVDSQLVNYTLV